MMKTRTLLLAIGGVLLAGAITFPLLSRKDSAVSAQNSPNPTRPVVSVVPAEVRSMQRVVRLSGTLKSGSEANLSPKAGGKILAVNVRTGQNVRHGEILVKLDASDSRRQAEGAAAALQAARANWEKAVQGENLKRVDVERRITDAQRGVELAKLQVQKAEAGIKVQSGASQADVERAQAGVDAARAALAQAQRGARPEQRAQAQIGVRQAERGVALAKKNLDDLEYLLGKGGVPRVQVDSAREDYRKAQDGLDQAKSQLALVEAGAGKEEIAAAEAQVRNAEAALKAAKVVANRGDVDRVEIAQAKAQLRQAEDGLKAAQASRSELDLARADVKAARAAYDQALSGSQLASQQLQSADIVSPVDGVVTAVNSHVGEMAGPGQPVVSVVGTAGVYLEAMAPSRVVRDVQPGQTVSVTVDALPGRAFSGRVRSVGSVAGPDGRSFPIQIDVTAPANVLKPGGLARAAVNAEVHSGAVAAPVEAVRVNGEKTSVWLVRDGIVREVPVTVPVQDDHYSMLVGEVRSGDQVVVTAPPGVTPGDAVDPRRR